MKSKASPLIRNLTDLAAHVCADEATPRSIDRRVYKDTDCGPHISFLYQTAPEHVTKHVAEIRQDKGADRVHLSKLSPANPEVALFLGFDNGRDPYLGETVPADSPFVSLEAFAKACEEFSASNQKEKIARVARCVGCVRVWVTVEHPAEIEYVHSGSDVPPELANVPCVGIQIGSIVEGSDVEIDTSPMFFPFTCEKFDACLEYVNSEACAAWDEANANGNEEED